MNNTKMQDLIDTYEDHVARFAPQLHETFQRWKANPCYDFALLLQAYLDDLLARVERANQLLEDVHVR